MRGRGLTLLLALASLLAFYALWMQPLPSFDPDEAPRPTTSERRGNGYAGLFEWLERTGVDVRSWRERYTALGDADIPRRGNLMVLTLPGLDTFHNDEFGALDKWIRRGNTLLINAALLDQPGWAVARESVVVTEVESLTSIEFESRDAREARLDDTPLAERVRKADERAARKGDDEAEDESEDEDAAVPDPSVKKDFEVPEKIVLTATGPHALLAGVRTLGMETDYEPDQWSLRMPYDNFVLTLARAQDGEGAMFEQRVGNGRILIVAGGTLFTNRALANDDNARLMSNIVSVTVAENGAVLFDDLRQGLSASYDPARFYRDTRLYKTILILLGLWLAWVLGGTRLRAPPIAEHDPSEAELVRTAGGLLARTVASWHAARALFEHFFAVLARATRGAPPDDRWHWLERHAGLLPQDLDQLRKWYADAYAMKEVPLVPLRNLLDQLERRLKT